MKLIAEIADITTLEYDVIVNAANSTLLGGGGVDGAIHKAAGPKLLAECIQIGGCPLGSAVRTLAYDLPAKYIVHTVGPMWRGGDKMEEHFLVMAYRNSMTRALALNAKTIAFPAISTGIFKYPPIEAAAVAVKTVLEFNDQDVTVMFCCFDVTMLDIYMHTLLLNGVEIE